MINQKHILRGIKKHLNSIDDFENGLNEEMQSTEAEVERLAAQLTKVQKSTGSFQKQLYDEKRVTDLIRNDLKYLVKAKVPVGLIIV